MVSLSRRKSKTSRTRNCSFRALDSRSCSWEWYIRLAGLLFNVSVFVRHCVGTVDVVDGPLLNVPVVVEHWRFGANEPVILGSLKGNGSGWTIEISTVLSRQQRDTHRGNSRSETAPSTGAIEGWRPYLNASIWYRHWTCR